MEKLALGLSLLAVLYFIFFYLTLKIFLKDDLNGQSLEDKKKSKGKNGTRLV